VKSRFCLAAAVLAGLFGSLPAADLGAIDRTIAREPAYKSKTPKYCLLVFGPEAKTRVWLVLDGDTLYVDRNGNGDLTEKGEMVALPKFETEKDNGPILGRREVHAGTIAAGPAVKNELMLDQIKFNPGYKPKDEREADIIELIGRPADGMVTAIRLTSTNLERLKSGAAAKANANDVEPLIQMAVADHTGVLQFGARPQEAPIIHFNGPLQIALHPQQKLERGAARDLAVGIGTPGLGKGTFAMRDYQRVPMDAHPVVDLEFPHREAGKPAIKLRVTLKERC
jgi:hypothetical protein